MRSEVACGATSVLASSNDSRPDGMSRPVKKERHTAGEMPNRYSISQPKR